MAELIIDDSTKLDIVFPANKSRGAIPRDYSVQPATMFDPPSQMKLIPRSEWSDRIKAQTALKARLSDVRNIANGGKPFPSLDQGPVGYCWAHSTTHAVMLQRAVAGQPYVPLSAYAIAATIKKGRDEGGWGALSAEFARDKGIPAQSLWPQGDRNYRNHDKPEVWADAAKHKIAEDWMDLTRDVYDRDLSFDQLATCLLAGIPCVVDFNWWAHSVCAIDLVEVESGSFGIRILNSWGDSWSENGTGILRGSKAIPDGAMAVRAVTVA